MHSRSILLLAVLATAPAACSDEGAGQEEATFDAVVKTVLAPSCTFASCHATPTVAAALDLTAARACNTLINKPSCLFPDRMRVVPGSPDDSFFFRKLTGEGLDEAPTGTCAESNLIMPFGATALPAEHLELVRNWIAAGASCENKPDVMPPPGDDGTPPVIESLSASRSAPIAGETIMITVTLNKPAPMEGQLVEIDPDLGAFSLSSPVQVVVPPEATTAKFDVYALRPASRFTVRATTGQSSKQIILRIGGLDVTEVLADPVGMDDGRQWVKIHNRSALPIELSNYELKSGVSSYDYTKLQLSGTLPPGSCALIGGPKQGPSDPPFWQAFNFTPDLPHVTGGATGFAVFDRLTPPIDAIPTPVDAIIVGANNDGRFLGPDAEIPAPYCITPSTGLSVLRTGSTACVSAVPQPGTCP